MNTLQGGPPILLTVIDTEEEFDWQAPFTREATSVTAMDQIGRGQEIFDQFGIRPVYVVDYPIATSKRGNTPLREFLHAGRAIIGAHLHPWVNPPFDEPLCARNSFPGNLPRPLEAEKLQVLVEAIKTGFGAPPVVYKAGRYGAGPNTHALLEELGFEVDLSPAPPFDYRTDGGPDFSRHPNHPQWFGARRRLLSLPTTGGYVGLVPNRLAHELFTWSRRPLPALLRVPGMLARSGLLHRLRLSPEGHTLDEMKQLTHTLLRQGVRIFSCSFHSPTLLPGCAPYVRNDMELQRFLDCLRGYCDFFLSSLGGLAMTPMEIKHLLQTGSE